MTANAASPAADSASAPIVLKTIVPCSPSRAFDYFTCDIGRWWPLADYSCGLADARDVRFDAGVGGRIVETTRDGTAHVWGTVSSWRPGERVAFSWHPGGDPARAMWVDVQFAANPGGTLVTLTHGGFEALGERGADVRRGYAGGWQTVFVDAFTRYCNEHRKQERP